MQDLDLAGLADMAVALVTTWGLRVIGAIVVLLIGRWVAARIKRGVILAVERAGADETLAPFLSGLVYWLALAVVIVAVLGLFGVPTASVVAVLGAAGLAVGLALQGTLSNFAAGVMLLVFRPLKVGDLVEVGGSLGKVAEVGIFSSVLNTPDNVRIIVPNSEVFGKPIKNYTANETRRIDLVIGVSYGDDLSVAKAAIERVVAADARVLKDPAPQVAVSNLGDSSVDFVVRPWCTPDAYWDVRFEMTRRIKEELEAAGCTIPFPQRDVHLFRASDAA
ncbi:MAG: mechanosensitive ion channel [Gemmatimonadota bacterium]|nr:MAG: mechanosensitive ion channel [Gemmatimonadota bacterium]